MIRFSILMIFGAVFSIAELVDAGGPGSDTFSQAPQVDPQFKAGDVLAISSDGASLMVGDKTVAVLPKGQRIVVVEFRSPWIGTYVVTNGQSKSGWIRTIDFLPTHEAANPGGPLVYTAQKPVLPENVGYTASSPTSNSYQDDYFADYLNGYYTRHETDPNIHVWEPWTYRR